LKCLPLRSKPTPRGRFSVAIPASVVSDTPHLREKTAKLGAIARASSIFGVAEIFLYPDDTRHDQRADIEFCSKILQYVETPQYLRKRAFKLNPAFKFTGILPPLQAPHHNVPRTMASVKVGDIREGLVFARKGPEAIVDVGLEKPVSVVGDTAVGERVTLHLVSVGKDTRGEIVEPSGAGTYWGYKVKRSSSLGKLLQEAKFGLRVGTSRYGSPIMNIWPSLTAQLKTVESVLIAFGSPKLGLQEILRMERLDAQEVFDHFVNMVPDQQTLTVRTEEAVFISLGILNLAKLERA